MSLLHFTRFAQPSAARQTWQPPCNTHHRASAIHRKRDREHNIRCHSEYFRSASGERFGAIQRRAERKRRLCLGTGRGARLFEGTDSAGERWSSVRSHLTNASPANRPLDWDECIQPAEENRDQQRDGAEQPPGYRTDPYSGSTSAINNFFNASAVKRGTGGRFYPKNSTCLATASQQRGGKHSCEYTRWRCEWRLRSYARKQY